MKKSKIMLPLLAFVFAVVAAFATGMSKKDSSQTYFYKNTSDVCVQCNALPENVQECAPDEDGEICKCQIQNTPDLGNMQDANIDCNVLKRPDIN